MSSAACMEETASGNQRTYVCEVKNGAEDNNTVVLRSFSHFRWLCSVVGCHRCFVCLEFARRAWNNMLKLNPMNTIELN